MAAEAQRPPHPPGEQDIAAHQRGAQDAEGPRRCGRQADQARHHIRPQEEHEPAERQEAEPDGRAAEQDDLANLEGAEAEAGIEAVAQGAAAERSDADIVADGETHERSQSDIPIGQRPADIADAERVEAGQAQIARRNADKRQRQVGQRDSENGAGNLRQAVIAECPVAQPQPQRQHDDRDEDGQSLGRHRRIPWLAAHRR